MLNRLALWFLAAVSIAFVGCMERGVSYEGRQSGLPKVASEPGDLTAFQEAAVVIRLHLSRSFDYDWRAAAEVLQSGAVFAPLDGTGSPVEPIFDRSEFDAVWRHEIETDGATPFIKVTPEAPLDEGWYVLKFGAGFAERFSGPFFPDFYRAEDGRYGIRVARDAAPTVAEIMYCQGSAGPSLQVSFSHVAQLEDGVLFSDAISVKDERGSPVPCPERAVESGPVSPPYVSGGASSRVWTGWCELPSRALIKIAGVVDSAGRRVTALGTAEPVEVIFASDELPKMGVCAVWAPR